MTPQKQVTIYTDGACKGNPGIGGWGALLMYNEHEKEIFGGEKSTTNNRMEMTSVIKALSALKSPCSVTVYLDSMYVKNGITKWINGWKKSNWKNSKGQPVKNMDLWIELDDIISKSGHVIKWQWVRGHTGNPGNERADALANKGIYSFYN